MSRKTRKQPIRKRSFLLFELLLSLGLILLCLFPMIKTHTGIAREEMRQVRAMQREQEIRAAMCQLKIDLHEHKYTWEELMKGVKTDAYKLTKRVQSTKQNSHESGLVLEATIPLGKEKVERVVYVEKKKRAHTH